VKWNPIFGLGTVSLDLDGKRRCKSTVINKIKWVCRRYGAGGPSQHVWSVWTVQVNCNQIFGLGGVSPESEVGFSSGVACLKYFGRICEWTSPSLFSTRGRAWQEWRIFRSTWPRVKTFWMVRLSLGYGKVSDGCETLHAYSQGEAQGYSEANACACRDGGGLANITTLSGWLPTYSNCRKTWITRNLRCEAQQQIKLEGAQRKYLPQNVRRATRSATRKNSPRESAFCTVGTTVRRHRAGAEATGKCKAQSQEDVREVRTYGTRNDKEPTRGPRGAPDTQDQSGDRRQGSSQVQERWRNDERNASQEYAMRPFEWRALLSLTPLSFGIDRYPRLPTQLFIWVLVPAALLPTGPGIQTLTPVKTPTHDIRMVGPCLHRLHQFRRSSARIHCRRRTGSRPPRWGSGCASPS